MAFYPRLSGPSKPSSRDIAELSEARLERIDPPAPAPEAAKPPAPYDPSGPGDEAQYRANLARVAPHAVPLLPTVAGAHNRVSCPLCGHALNDKPEIAGSRRPGVLKPLLAAPGGEGEGPEASSNDPVLEPPLDVMQLPPGAPAEDAFAPYREAAAWIAENVKKGSDDAPQT